MAFFFIIHLFLIRKTEYEFEEMNTKIKNISRFVLCVDDSCRVNSRIYEFSVVIGIDDVKRIRDFFCMEY